MSRKRFLWMTAEVKRPDEWMYQATDTEGQIRVLLPSGAIATVAPDVSLKTLMALDEMAALVVAHCLEETKGLMS